jgi:two-component system sensor histidine kinase YesM
MHFRNKLIVTYSVLVTVLILLAGFIFGGYSYRHMEETSYQELRILAENLSHQLDEIVRPMTFITDFLLSDPRALSAITVLNRTKRVGSALTFIDLAKIDIQSILISNCSNRSFHRVNYFNVQNDFFSSSPLIDTIPDGFADVSGFPKIFEINEARGKPVLIAPFMDPWALRNPEKVFSIVRLVMGNETASYIEVQKPFAVLENVYNLSNSAGFKAGLINGQGEFFFSQFSGDQNSTLIEYFKNKPNPGNLTHIEDNIATSYHSSYTDTYTVVMRSRESTSALYGIITRTIIFASLLVFLLSVVCICILSFRISYPIRELVEKMENTNLDNIDYNAPIVYPNDEFTRLHEAYNRLLKRLKTAVDQEKEASLLHLQAEFNTLQTQINPHFIYNILNVISHRGVINGDETICTICEKIASMLRFSAGTSRRMVTIREELDYVEDYLYLLKTRFRKRLEYHVEVEPPVLKQIIPKMVLQPVIGNSINHGFKDESETKEITIRGWADNEYWYIKVMDNGRGLCPDKKTELEQKMKNIRSQITAGNYNTGLDIGGMGLLNIYARFRIMFGDDIIFSLGGNPAGGACITIGAKKADTGV